VPSKFSNWQKLFSRSTITLKVTRLLALQVCLPITPSLILLLRNHGFWIAEQDHIASDSQDDGSNKVSGTEN